MVCLAVLKIFPGNRTKAAAHALAENKRHLVSEVSVNYSRE